MSELRKAVVTMAGRGSRFFPASHALRKELFPVMGPEGVVRPLVHQQLRTLLRAGFEEIALVVAPGERDFIEGYFDGPAGVYRMELSGAERGRAELEEMRRIRDCLRIVEQDAPEGFAHALLQAKAFAGGEAILLCTGDLLFRGPCYQELASAYAESGGRSVSAVTEVTASELYGYGVIGGRRLAEDPRLIEVERMLEKPLVEQARAELRVEGLPEDSWLGWFGLHALAPSIFEVIEGMIRDGIRDGGELQLTRAQDIQRERHGYLAREVSGSERFDFGLPEKLLDSLQRYARED